MPHGSRLVTVDPELCMGSGDCVRTAPGAFRLDDERNVSIPQLEGVTAAPLERLVEAARQCPTNAIRVVDDEGQVVVDSA
ncbi:MAG TPA: ferredoxin [Candidatus Limnocylindrales bacterium]|nr:ferredoxin [Candidatus Limnocylindrales bacterium]